MHQAQAGNPGPEGVPRGTVPEGDLAPAHAEWRPRWSARDWCWASGGNAQTLHGGDGTESLGRRANWCPCPTWRFPVREGVVQAVAPDGGSRIKLAISSASW